MANGIRTGVNGSNFLGFGLLRPFRRDRKRDFAAAGGEQLIRSAIGQILGTRGSSEFTQGELAWRAEFGSLLHTLRHQKNDIVLQELGRTRVAEALKRWEPRIVVTAINVSGQTQEGDNVLVIRIRFDIIDENVPGNNVLVPGIEQTVTV